MNQRKVRGKKETPNVLHLIYKATYCTPVHLLHPHSLCLRHKHS